MDLHPILSCSGAKAFEDQLFTGTDSAWQAMQAAGTALGQAVLHDFLEIGPWPSAPRILVLAGTGNNAGDAFLAATEIQRVHPSAQITVLFVFGQDASKPQSRRAFDILAMSAGAQLTIVNGPALDLASLSTRWHLVLDGMMGMQFHPPMQAPAAAVLNWVNSLGHEVLFRAAVDLPSGLSDQPIAIESSTVFQADFTYATGVVKAPAVAPENARAVGRLRYLDLGFFATHQPEPYLNYYVAPDTLLDPLRRLRPSLSDKRSYGHVYLLGGSAFMSGAILMAIHAAVRSGAGLVTGLVPGPLATRLAISIPEAMWIPLPVESDGTLSMETLMITRQSTERAGAFVLGPGMELDKYTRILMARLAREISLPLVLDASSLLPDVMSAVVGRPADSGPLICTPHMGEYARMTRTESSGAPADRDLLEFSKRHFMVIVLKGPITRITDGAKIVHVLNGGPVLARGGSGDMLAGMIGAQLAQHPADPLLAACSATLWHASASDHLAQARGQVAVRSTDLLDFLGAALRSRLPVA